MNRMNVLLIAMVVVIGLSSMSEATLTVVGDGTINGGTIDYQLIYDSAQNITWLDYTNPADTWQNQKNWASGVTVNFDGQNIAGWSLPTTVDAFSSFNYPPDPTSSEMAYLYYTELGNTTSSSLANAGPFKNLQAAVYWSGTEYSAIPGDAWGFNTNNGLPSVGPEGVSNDGLAVLPGDVAASTVPEPGTVVLVGTGLAAFVMISKRRRG